jgi:hypothetical protein
MDGTIGGVGRVPRESWNSPHIDIFTSHYYGGSAFSHANDAKTAASYGKAFIVGEYGFGTGTWYDDFMKTTINTQEVSGSLIWSLRYVQIAMRSES